MANHLHRFRHLLVGSGLALALGLACSSPDSGDGGSDGGSDSGKGSGGRSSSGTGAAGNSDDGDSGSGSGSTGSGSGGKLSGTGGASGDSSCGISSEGLGGRQEITPAFESCAESSNQAEVVPADVFILVDQSISMEDNRVNPADPSSPTRWEALTTAIKAFIESPSSEGLRVGLQYFGLTKNGAVLCDPEDYNGADVEIGELPGNAEALLDSLDAHFPSSSTPSVPALEGALRHAKAWALEHPDRPVVVVFATDGYPTECERNSIPELQAVAAEYAQGTPRIPTFVVGIGQVSNLKLVAQAGGTQKAFFVADCPTAVEDLTVMLERIASSPAICEYQLPELQEGEFLDKSKINLAYYPDKGVGGEALRQVSGEAACGDGWHFDDNARPTKVIACPETCRRLGGGTVDLVVGCETLTLK